MEQGKRSAKAPKQKQWGERKKQRERQGGVGREENPVSLIANVLLASKTNFISG